MTCRGSGKDVDWGETPLQTLTVCEQNHGSRAEPVPTGGPAVSTMFVLIMNGSHRDHAHRLNDGGLLLSCSGNSYTTYMKEEGQVCGQGHLSQLPATVGSVCRLRLSVKAPLQDLLGLLGGSSRGWNPQAAGWHPWKVLRHPFSSNGRIQGFQLRSL